MELRELFGLSENDKQLSVQTIKNIFDLDIVVTQHYNKWLLFRDDEFMIDFIDSYNVSKDADFDHDMFAVYFQEDNNNTRLVISRDFINDKGEKDAEMYHFFIRRFGLELDDVLVFYQAHNLFSQKLNLLTTKDEAQNNIAISWFNFISNLLFAVNNLYVFDNQITEMVFTSQIMDLNTLNQEPPLTHVYFGGVAYNVVSLKVGFDYLKGLKSVSNQTKDLFTYANLFFDSLEQETYFLVCDQNAEVDELELLDFIEEYDIFVLGYIFLADLIVTNSLFCEDLNFSPSLIVKGNLTVKNAYFSGNTHYIGGNVYGDLLYAKNNLGELHINGYLDTSCIIAQDMPCYIRSIQTKAIISDDSVFGIDSVLDNKGVSTKVMNIYPTTCRVEDVIIDEIKKVYKNGEYFPNDDDIVEAFNEGKSVVNLAYNKIYADFNETISLRFNSIFNEIIDGKGQANLKLKDGINGHYFYATFFNDGKKYREIGRKNKEHNYQSRIVHDVDNNVYTALLEYYQDNGLIINTVFQSELTDRYSSTYVVLHAFNLAEEEFKKEKGFI